MRILIVGPIFHHHIINFTTSLRKYTSWSFDGFNTVDSSYEYKKGVYNHIYNPTNHGHRSAVKRLMNYISSVSSFLKAVPKADLVQFQFIRHNILPHIVISRILGKKVSCFVWGSDFLRSSKKQKKILSIIFRLSHSIVCDSSDLLSKLRERYSFIIDKSECLLFGSTIVDKIYSITIKKQYCQSSVSEKQYDKIIMCGYNASKSQNHERIIDSIESVKGNFLWVFPLTYGRNEEYIKEIKRRLNASRVSYVTLDSFVNEEDWIKYIIASDIFIHIQESDSFSSTIAEHLTQGNILINGDWLCYREFDENNIFYRSVNLENLTTVLQDTIDNYDLYRVQSEKNKTIMYRMKSLEWTLKDYWIPYLNNLLK